MERSGAFLRGAVILGNPATIDQQNPAIIQPERGDDVITGGAFKGPADELNLGIMHPFTGKVEPLKPQPGGSISRWRGDRLPHGAGGEL